MLLLRHLDPNGIAQIYKCLLVSMEFALKHEDFIDDIRTIKGQNRDAHEMENIAEFVKMFNVHDFSFWLYDFNPVKLYKRGISQMGESNVKPLDQLLKEITNLNASTNIQMNDLDKQYRSVIAAVTAENPFKLAKADWLKLDKFQKISIVKKAMEKFRSYTVRDTQLLSLLMMYQNKGRLAQVNTGEGKTDIVAMFAVLHALDGKKVDIGK